MGNLFSLDFIPRWIKSGDMVNRFYLLDVLIQLKQFKLDILNYNLQEQLIKVFIVQEIDLKHV